MEEPEGEEFSAGLAESVRERGHGDGEAYYTVVAVYDYADHVLVYERHVLSDIHLDLLVCQSGEFVQYGVGVVEHGEDLFGPALYILGLAGYNDGDSVFSLMILSYAASFSGTASGTMILRWIQSTSLRKPSFSKCSP